MAIRDKQTLGWGEGDSRHQEGRTELVIPKCPSCGANRGSGLEEQISMQVVWQRCQGYPQQQEKHHVSKSRNGRWERAKEEGSRDRV